MKDQCIGKFNFNNHWNNHVRFYIIIEAYLTLCYAIKKKDVGLLKIAMCKVTIIFQALSAKKPKYTWEMLHQIYIFDINVANPVLQNAYIANALVNLRGLPFNFYKMDLFLEYQNKKFKRFWSDWGLLL